MSGPAALPRRVLVANRGEIAVRVLRTLGRLGVEGVAVYSEADGGAPHVAMAGEAVLLGPAPAAESYLRADAVIAAALATGADAVHPGYGFLSEDASFARATEEAGLAFLGPTPDQLATFGDKLTARAAATEAGVSLLAGTELLVSLPDALDAASQIGYPVMLKTAGGGGGIGMAVCEDAAALTEAWDRVRRTAQANFGNPAAYLERYVRAARHVEVQVFGDGAGEVVVLGDRDCSAQRRNQKVLEEAPAPDLEPAMRSLLGDAARNLAASVSWRSAGTVEFLVDVERADVAFLEVNARLQVEHPVTEAIFGVDLVEWMVRLGAGDTSMVHAPLPEPSGHAVEVRVYAEDPARDFRPSVGRLTEVSVPDGPGLRWDTWVATGSEVSPHYDPLLGKLIAHGATRAEALDILAEALRRTRLTGIETNGGFLAALVDDPTVRSGKVRTDTVAGVNHQRRAFEVLVPGAFTTVQDHPGRVGYWAVGVPPSGPMDDRSFRLANQVVGNAPGAAALEATAIGPTLCFETDAVICVGGADMGATLDGAGVPSFEPVDVPAGAVLALGAVRGPGVRTYVAIRGAIDVPPYLGSRATFTLGGFGGHAGRVLRTGDVVHLSGEVSGLADAGAASSAVVPVLTHAWEIGVLAGPHAAPDYFTDDDVEEFYAAAWQVHHNSARTGVRLVGPTPRWARSDGGEAGLHPSNINDNPYAVGAVDFTGDMPIILGPDGPSLGGFVCPATIASGELWKMGQLAPGDTVRFVALSPAPAIMGRQEAGEDRPSVTFRRSGDANLLVEYGPDVLDLDLRLRVHALAEQVRAAELTGVLDITAGIRSLQVHVDSRVTNVDAVLEAVRAADDRIGDVTSMTVPSRTVWLPLSWDDPATLEATRRYESTVRADAPWCPHNLEFIRRINGLDSIDDVQRVVFDASYLVLGLGDVYLGAPVATPVDPRHRLVTTKYNPARTWTPENAVGIGGSYLCVYGMEGPGGYQFVGRTVPVWNTWRHTAEFEPGTPWLLREFDQLRFYPVSAEELLDLRRDLLVGRTSLRIEHGTFSLAEHHQFLDSVADEIEQFRSRQQAAFGVERAAWAAAGEFDRAAAAAADPAPGDNVDNAPVLVPDGGVRVDAPMGASVWQVSAKPGQQVQAGEPLVVLEAMKMETAVTSPIDAEVYEVVCTAGSVVAAGDPLVVLVPSAQNQSGEEAVDG